MYQCTYFDREFVRLRALQFRGQLERWQRGGLGDEQRLPLRWQTSLCASSPKPQKKRIDTMTTHQPSIETDGLGKHLRATSDCA